MEKPRKNARSKRSTVLLVTVLSVQDSSVKRFMTLLVVTVLVDQADYSNQEQTQIRSVVLYCNSAVPVQW